VLREEQVAHLDAQMGRWAGELQARLGRASPTSPAPVLREGLIAIGDGQRFDRDAHAERGSYLGQRAQCWIDLTGRKESPHGGWLGADRASKGRLR
jgi:hypothetical protein